MNIWFTNHIHAIGNALGQFRRSPGHFFFNILVLAMTLALPFGGITLLDNVQSVTRQLSVSPEISVFLKADTSAADAAATGQSIARIFQAENQNIELVFITKDAALQSLQKKTGLADVVDSLGSNPLPDSYIIRLKDATDNRNLSAQVESAALQLQKLPFVDKVQVDSDWTKRLAALLSVMRMGLLFLAIILSVVVIVVTFNTVRLQVLMHLDEITVSWHIGASRAYIRRPFYYMGIFLGLFSGIIALVLIDLCLYPFNTVIVELAQLYGSNFQLAPLSPLVSAILLTGSAVLGWLGAILSVNRQLWKIN